MSKESDDPTGLLLLVGLFRDELPWLHELGLEFYRAIKRGNPSQMKKAFHALMMALDLTRHGPLSEGIRDEETYMMIREPPHVLDRYLMRAMDNSQTRARKSAKATTK